MRVTKDRSPVPTTHRDDREFGKNNRPTNCSGNFLGALDTESNVTFRVSNDDKGLEASALPSPSLFLDRHNFHDLILELGEEEIHNLEFLDGEREEVNFLD